MAAPTVVQSAKNNDPGTPTSLAATFASGPTQGNLLVAVVSSEALFRNTRITGWRLHRRQTGRAGDTISFFSKVAGASESSTVTALFDSNSRTAMVIFEVSGADEEGPTEWGERSATTGTSQAGASVTPIAGLDVLLIQVNAANNAQGITTQPSGYTSIAEEVVNDGNSIRLSTWYKAQTNPSGSYTGGTTVYAGNVNFNGLHIAIPAPQTATTLSRRQFQSSNNTGAGNVTSRSVTLSALQVGNTLVASFSSVTSAAPTFPAGWTTLMSAQDSGLGTYFSLAVKEIAPGQSTTITVTFSSRNTATLTVSEITGRYISFAQNAFNGVISVGVATAISMPSRTGQTDHLVLSFIEWTNGQIIGAPPAGFLDHREDFTGGTPSAMTESMVRVLRSSSTTISGTFLVGQGAVNNGANRATLLFAPRRPKFGQFAVFG